MSNLLFSAEEFPLAIESVETLIKAVNEDVDASTALLKRAGNKFGGDKANLKLDYVTKKGDEPAPLETCIRTIKIELAVKKEKLLDLTMMINKLRAIHDMLDELEHE
jgi:transcription elongation factor GreA-like protein